MYNYAQTCEYYLTSHYMTALWTYAQKHQCTAAVYYRFDYVASLMQSIGRNPLPACLV